MQCISPMSLPRPDGYGSIDRITVPCGRCPTCLQNKRDDWSFRLSQELKAADTANFITLTYDEKNVPERALSKTDLQLFMKKLRHKVFAYQALNVENIPGIKPLKYYMVSEYGENTLRGHYHAIIFNLPSDFDVTYKLINETWDKGFIHIGKVTPASIHYVTGYIVTKSKMSQFCEDNDIEMPFALISKGMGRKYLESAYYHQANLTKITVLEGGYRKQVPRYYLEKIFAPDTLKRLNEECSERGLYQGFANYEKLIKKGFNPFRSEIEGKQQLINNYNKHLKNRSL